MKHTGSQKIPGDQHLKDRKKYIILILLILIRAFSNDRLQNRYIKKYFQKYILAGYSKVHK
jgi:hypothetical protein